MSAKKKKQSGDPWRIILIVALLGLMAYKYRLTDGNQSGKLPAEPVQTEKAAAPAGPKATQTTTEKAARTTQASSRNGALEIPVMKSRPEVRLSDGRDTPSPTTPITRPRNGWRGS